MAASIVDLEDGYFKALHEVIVETERALRDVSQIDTHYVSQVVTVMSAWQEVVQTAASHMEGVDTTIYLVRHEDVQRVTQEYVTVVVKAREERNTAHAVEQGVWRQALKDNDHGDPVVHLLSVTRQAARAQCEKAVDVFLSSIEKTLRKHVPPHVQAISIVQVIVETFPKNCALMFPLALPHPQWLRSPVLSGRSHLMTMTMTIIMMLAPASVDLIPACRCPHTGTLAELAKQVVLTRPLPYFTGVPSVYQRTPRSHPVALLVQLQMRTRSMVHC